MTEPSKIKWPLKYRFWNILHGIINRFAWMITNSFKVVNPKTHPVWRLNDWVANHYVPWWLEQRTGRKFTDEAES